MKIEKDRITKRGKLKSTLREMSKKRHCYLLLIPTFALLLTFNYYPAFSAIYHSFFQWNGFNLENFIGLGNFKEIWYDPVMRASTINMTKLTIAGIVISVTAPLFAAKLIFSLRNLKVGYFYRVLFVLPMMVPWIVSLLIWSFIYNPNIGLLNQILTALGLENWTRAWLGDFDISLIAIIFIGFPWISGFSLLIYLAGLQAISESVLDAAVIDGCSALSRFWRIELPLVMAQIKLIVILSIIGIIQGYVNIMILTGGGPGDATMVPGLHMYNSAFFYNRMGYGCAVGTLLFVIVLSLTYLNLRYIRSNIEY